MWQYIIRQLKNKFPPGVPVEIKTVPLNDDFDASCEGIIKLNRLIKIVILINSHVSWKIRKDSLFHEWAHAMDFEANWTDNSPKKEHGETWGVWYSKIYQYIIDDCWDDMVKKNLVN